MTAHYSIIIQWSDEDRCYIASLPEFGPYALTHGATYEEALAHGQAIMQLLMDTTAPLPHPSLFQPAVSKAA